MLIENEVVKKVSRDYERETVMCALELIKEQERANEEKRKRDFWNGFADAMFCYSVAREVGVK